MNRAIVLGLVRHLLTALGGVLVANGDLDQMDLEATVGALITVFGAVWSVIHKRNTQRKLDAEATKLHAALVDADALREGR